MSRGICYGIDTDETAATFFTGDSIRDLSDREFIGVGDENLKQDVDGFVSWVKKNGVPVEKITVGGERVYCFTMNENLKRAWFKKRFVKLKNVMKELTLDDFALKNQTSLKWLVEADFDDAVYSSTDSFQSMDRWFRESIPGQKYFLAHAYEMD
jgi:hypothetical protein